AQTCEEVAVGVVGGLDEKLRGIWDAGFELFAARSGFDGAQNAFQARGVVSRWLCLAGSLCAGRSCQKECQGECGKGDEFFHCACSVWRTQGLERMMRPCQGESLLPLPPACMR